MNTYMIYLLCLYRVRKSTKMDFGKLFPVLRGCATRGARKRSESTRVLLANLTQLHAKLINAEHTVLPQTYADTESQKTSYADDLGH